MLEYLKDENLLVTDDGQEFQNMSEVVIGGATYYVKIPEKYLSSLGLLEKGIETPEEAYNLHHLLQTLKGRKLVIAVDDEGNEINRATARRNFLAALRDKESLHAHNLKTRLEEEGAEEYIS